VPANRKRKPPAEPAASKAPLGEKAYESILEMLFDRRIPAGAFVSQSDLVALVGVPLAPTRDALKVLEVEGIVTIHPGSGIQFVKPGFELTRSTYQYRGILERAAIAVYAEVADEAELAELERRHLAVVAEIERDGLAGDTRRRIEALETALHSAIIASLDNPLIDTSYRRIHNYLKLIRLERRTSPSMALKSLREHLQVISACRAHDPEAAVAALSAHFDAALKRALGLY
jgi:DNA-binding GntR family transcriptional regulator